MTGTIWDAVLARIETKVNRYSYQTWFKDTALLADEGHSIAVRVPDPLVVDWLMKHYAAVLAESLAEAGRPGARVRFLAEGPETTRAVLPEPPIEPEGEEDLPLTEEDAASTEAGQKAGL